MDFCSIFTIAKVIVGSVKKGWKIWRVLLLEVFLIGGILTELCLYILSWRFIKHTYKKAWKDAQTVLSKKSYKKFSDWKIVDQLTN